MTKNIERLPTESDTILIRESLILPVMLDTLSADIRVLETSTLKIPSVPIAAMRKLQDWALSRQNVLKKELVRSGIKIIDKKRDNKSVRVTYLCRGYYHDMILLGDIIKAEIEMKLAELIGVNIYE